MPSAHCAIREWFSYDPETGIVRWLQKASKNTVVGSEAGFAYKSRRNGNEYIVIQFNGKRVRAHNVAFILMTGQKPRGEIDHINGTGTDNTWKNLRDVVRKINSRNQKQSSKNTSGVTGVDFHRAANGWRARITVDYKEFHLGVFSTKEEAVVARKDAERRFSFHENHGRIVALERHE